MKTTNNTTPNTRCYIMSSEDLNKSKKLKGLFRMMHLEEVTPYGSILSSLGLDVRISKKKLMEEEMTYYKIQET